MHKISKLSEIYCYISLTLLPLTTPPPLKVSSIVAPIFGPVVPTQPSNKCRGKRKKSWEKCPTNKKSYALSWLAPIGWIKNVQPMRNSSLLLLVCIVFNHHSNLNFFTVGILNAIGHYSIEPYHLYMWGRFRKKQSYHWSAAEEKNRKPLARIRSVHHPCFGYWIIRFRAKVKTSRFEKPIAQPLTMQKNWN